MRKQLLLLLVFCVGTVSAMDEHFDMGMNEQPDMSSMILDGYREIFRSTVDLDCCESPIGWAANIIKFNYQRAYYERPLHPATVFGLAGCLMVSLGATAIGCTECPTTTTRIYACCGLAIRKACIMEKYGLIPTHVKKD